MLYWMLWVLSRMFFYVSMWQINIEGRVVIHNHFWTVVLVPECSIWLNAYLNSYWWTQTLNYIFCCVDRNLYQLQAISRKGLNVVLSIIYIWQFIYILLSGSSWLLSLMKCVDNSPEANDNIVFVIISCAKTFSFHLKPVPVIQNDWKLDNTSGADLAINIKKKFQMNSGPKMAHFLSDDILCVYRKMYISRKI